MSKVTCISKPTKFKNLTLNKEYDNVVVEDEAVILSNDSGFRAKYAKKYFRIQPETPVAPPAPAIRNLLDELTVTVDEDGMLTVVLNRTQREIGIETRTSGVSCGITELTDLESIQSIVNEMYNNKVPSIVGTKEEMFRKIMEVIIDDLKNMEPAMCYIMSDNTNNAAYAPFRTVLSEMAVHSVEGRNPNSNNNIILWILR